MDIKLNNATGELHIEKGDVQFFGAKEKYFEVIQQIRDKIMTNFRDYLSRCYIETYEYENRHLKINIGLIFNNNELALMKGVGIGWQE